MWFKLPPVDRGNLRIYPPLPPAVCKRRTNEAALVCPCAAELMANVNRDYLITVSSMMRLCQGDALSLLALCSLSADMP